MNVARGFHMGYYVHESHSINMLERTAMEWKLIFHCFEVNSEILLIVSIHCGKFIVDCFKIHKTLNF